MSTQLPDLSAAEEAEREATQEYWRIKHIEEKKQFLRDAQARFEEALVKSWTSQNLQPAKGLINLMNTTDTGKVPLTVEAILAARGSTCGSFAENSEYAGKFLAVINDAQARRTGNREPLTPFQLNALIMISQKMSRILSAPDASYADNWDDIAGYAKLGASGK